jgi:hypothetical protein
MIHAFSWTILFSLPSLLRPDFTDYNKIQLKSVESVIKLITGIMKLFWVAFFYLNAKLFIPKLIYRKRYPAYVAAVLGILLLLLAIDILLFHLMVPDLPYRFRNFLFFNVFPLLFMLVASTTYRLVIDRIASERKEKDRINENLKTELSLLRSQISPHFLFNVLNSMVAMARKKSDHLEDSLIKLSHLLRYMLYETAHAVPISREIGYLEDYIDLQQIRFGAHVDIRYKGEVGDQTLLIEPMLLIPFVENAFKHGVVMIDNPEIHISLTNQNKTLFLAVRNRYNPSGAETKDASSGIGLENVERRLSLLYEGRHVLQMEKVDSWYIVNLTIELL